MISQAGHAYLGAFETCKDKEVKSEYHRDFPNSPGTKVALGVSSLVELHKAAYEAEKAGLSTFIVVDSGCLNFFDGKPTVTALGIGPTTKSQIKNITRKFKLL